MNNFNFNSLADQKFTSDSQNYLKPYEIYLVKLAKIEKTTLKGSKDPNAEYSVINIEFSNDDGIFNTNLFVPNRPEDFDQRESETTHKKQPSNWEKFYMTLLQMMDVLNPKASEKFRTLAKEGKIKDTNTFIELVIKALSGKDFPEVYLKLVGRNSNGSVFASLPTSCWYNSKKVPAGVEPLNFISYDKTKLNFSTYEIQQSESYKKAKPTAMSSVDDTITEDDNTLDDLEL